MLDKTANVTESLPESLVQKLHNSDLLGQNKSKIGLTF